jgi:hypothetical protein
VPRVPRCCLEVFLGCCQSHATLRFSSSLRLERSWTSVPSQHHNSQTHTLRRETHGTSSDSVDATGSSCAFATMLLLKGSTACVVCQNLGSRTLASIGMDGSSQVCRVPVGKGSNYFDGGPSTQVDLLVSLCLSVHRRSCRHDLQASCYTPSGHSSRCLVRYK